MKKIRNLTTKLLILVLLLNLGCQNESLITQKQEDNFQAKTSYSSKTIFEQEIQANTKLSSKITDLEISKYNQINKDVYNQTYDFTINTDVAKLVENTNENKHSYTFSISRNNDTDSAIENLVLSYSESNENYNAGLVTYHFTDSQKQEYLSTGHVSTSYSVSFSQLDIDTDEILAKSELPCTVTYQEFHIPDGSTNTHHHSSNGYIVNECLNQGVDDEPCETYTEIIIYCPDSSGATGTTHDPSTSDPSDPNTTDYSTAGGGGSTNDDTTQSDQPADDTNIVTSLMTREESTKQSILNCINGLSTFDSVDNTTIDPEILNAINFSLSQWIDINDFLQTNGCSEDAQQEVIEEILEEAIKNAIIPPSCESFEYTNVNSNWQAAATKNIVALIGYYDAATGEFNTANILFAQPIYFEAPKYSEANGGYISPGRAAELTSKAVFLAIRRAKAYFLATNASESQVRAKLWEYIRDEMANGTYIVGGRASFTPPYGFTGNIIDYQSYWFFEDNCD